MSFPSYTSKTDNISEIQATDINILYTDVMAIAQAAAIGAYVNTETLTGNKTLVDADYTIQSFSPTAARDVTLPAFAGAIIASSIINNGCTYSLGGHTITGIRYLASENSVIYTGGGGASYYPGNSDGSTSTGGQYV